MYTPTFEYYRASTVEEAIELLSKHKEARLLAGGHSLLPAMKLRLAAPPVLIDVGRVEGLSGIERAGDRLRIGALTTHAAVAASEEVWQACPLLAETAEQIGDLQVRNRGTIGGSLAYADPGADYPTAVLALGATLVAQGPSGRREIPAAEFFTGMFQTALAPDEMLVEVQVPLMGEGQGGAYVKHRHPASSYAVVGVAALVTLQDGTCADVRLTVGGAVSTPIAAAAAQEALKGQPASQEAVAAAAARVAEAISDPLSDVYASGDYRRHLATVLAKRALLRAVERARG